VLLNGDKTDLSDDVTMAIVCDKMGWTFQEYREQPIYFIKTLLLKWSVENEVSNKKHGK